MASAWFAELACVTEPGGIVVVTYHGPHALDLIAKSEAHQTLLEITAADARAMAERLRHEHAILVPYGAALIETARVGTADYGAAFFAPGYLEEIAAPGFKLLEHRPGGVRGFQDVAVLRRSA